MQNLLKGKAGEPINLSAFGDEGLTKGDIIAKDHKSAKEAPPQINRSRFTLPLALPSRFAWDSQKWIAYGTISAHASIKKLSVRVKSGAYGRVKLDEEP